MMREVRNFPMLESQDFARQGGLTMFPCFDVPDPAPPCLSLKASEIVFPHPILGCDFVAVVKASSLKCVANGVCREVTYRHDAHGQAPKCVFHGAKCSSSVCEGQYDFWSYFRFSDVVESKEQRETKEKIECNFDMPTLFWAEDVLLVASGTGLKLYTDIDQKLNVCSVISKVRCPVSMEALLEFATSQSCSHLRIDLLSLVAFLRATLMTRQRSELDKTRFIFPETIQRGAYSDYFTCRSAISGILSLGSVHRRNGNIITHELVEVVEKLRLSCDAPNIDESQNIFSTSPEFADIVVTFAHGEDVRPSPEEIHQVLHNFRPKQNAWKTVEPVSWFG
jgi:hypothetical protein